MDQETAQLDKEMKERFTSLPKPVQDAITSADVEKHLRALADTHKLHLDQWDALESEVMLALLGFEPVADLAKNIESEVRLDTATAAALAADISRIVFAPIRGELERILEHPDARPQQQGGVGAVRDEVLARTDPAPTPPPTPAPAPATPPAPAPTQKVERAAISSAYAPGAPSHERKAIDGDPYREPIL